MNALQLLTADHNRVRGLFAQARTAHDNDDLATLSDLARQIFTELDVHTKIEEEIFYPEVKQASDELAEVVAEGLEEHHVVDQLIAEMKRLDPSDEAWAAKLTVMMENVEHHAEEEEIDMFPLVGKALDDARLTRLASRLETRKASLGAPTVADKEHLSTENPIASPANKASRGGQACSARSFWPPWHRPDALAHRVLNPNNPRFSKERVCVSYWVPDWPGRCCWLASRATTTKAPARELTRTTAGRDPATARTRSAPVARTGGWTSP